MEGNEVKPYRDTKALQTAMEELHKGIPELPEEERDDIESAVRALAHELHAGQPDPHRVQHLIAKLQQSSGRVAETAERLLNTTAIQTILYYAPETPPRVSQEPAPNND